MSEITIQMLGLDQIRRTHEMAYKAFVEYVDRNPGLSDDEKGTLKVMCLIAATTSMLRNPHGR